MQLFLYPDAGKHRLIYFSFKEGTAQICFKSPVTYCYKARCLLISPFLSVKPGPRKIVPVHGEVIGQEGWQHLLAMTAIFRFHKICLLLQAVIFEAEVSFLYFGL